ncbi:papain family cysteine protease (macronuclear) [Tetrahymena thermophila SB210]|uniref:Papain family cysteine protease n=1 Tax=Tetrahymena thermophila (strain SB210) TaxID=312017 RepID=Q24CQ1_TETTS|nr:papain family cysteine protease [Tetrahymena thermophila SB210]EAS05558.2 papain family cysteine protease [Tetrahymena thermophila SB210]|eukprot:XP_001025803.2 papain family cysteine protease [Tetrahymena thermophila SB210]
MLYILSHLYSKHQRIKKQNKKKKQNQNQNFKQNMNKLILLSIIMLMPLCLAQNISVEKLLAYNQWSSQHQRVYLNEDEKLFRQMVFFENLQKIQEHNSDPNNTYSIGLNKFSDMTKEEFAEKILMKSDFVDNLMKGINQEATHNDANKEAQFNSKGVSYAYSIDWRTKGAVTSVKDQGSCGSCWSFSAAGVMESYNFIRNKAALVDFSEQQLVDCVIPANGYNSYGCRGGWPVQCLDYASKVGITTLDKYPYVAFQNNCNVTDTNNGFKPKKWNQIANTPDDLKMALNWTPVSVVVDAYNWGSYYSGIFNGCDQSHISLNHAVLAVGYDLEGNWILKNSWGTNWGENGYMRLAANNTCGILSFNYLVTA